MQNGIFQTSWKSVGESVLTGVVLALLTALAGVVLATNFSVWTTDWISVGKAMVDVGTIALVTTFVKDFLSTNAGSLLGIGPTSAVTATPAATPGTPVV